MLPQMTPKQRQRSNALIKRLCANYDGGNCLLLDDGEPCVCVQSISYSLLCKYFRNAVLPAEPLLEAEILGTLPLSSETTRKNIAKSVRRKRISGSRPSTQERSVQSRKIEGKKPLKQAAFQRPHFEG